MGSATAHFLPLPLGPREGSKRSNIVKFQLQSQFQIFINVFSQMKDIKHIRRDFHSAAWVMPHGGTWGYRGSGGQMLCFAKIQSNGV